MIELQKFILILLMTLIIIYIYQLISKDNIKDNLTSIVQDCSSFHFNDVEKFNQYFGALFQTLKLEDTLIPNDIKSKKHKV